MFYQLSSSTSSIPLDLSVELGLQKPAELEIVFSSKSIVA